MSTQIVEKFEPYWDWSAVQLEHECIRRRVYHRARMKVIPCQAESHGSKNSKIFLARLVGAGDEAHLVRWLPAVCGRLEVVKDRTKLQ